MSHSRLQHALSQLPEYNPPPGLWEDIEAALDAEQMLAEAVQALPAHSPPATVWGNIEAVLEQQPRRQDSHVFSAHRYWPAAAAVLLLLIVAQYWMQQPAPATMADMPLPSPKTPVLPLEQPVPKTSAAATEKPLKTEPRNKTRQVGSVVFSKEVVDNQLLEVCREPENEAFALIEQLCRAQMPVCDIPEFKLLRSELDELTAARQELRQALGQYTADPQLVAQMVQLEQTRTAILQQLMQFI